MRLSRNLVFVLSMALLALSACGFDAVGCGPGEINIDGVCVLLETEDDLESTEPGGGGDLADDTEDVPVVDEPNDGEVSTGEQSEPGDGGQEDGASELAPSLTIDSLQLSDDGVSRLSLRLEGWRSEDGTLEGASYRGEDTQGDWLTLTEVVMDDVDSEKPWAAHKLVGTVPSDGTKRIVFFTDPEAASGQLELFAFDEDFAELLWGSEILTWDRDSVDGCDTSTLLEGYPVTAQSEASYTLRLDCWNPERSAPKGGAYADLSVDDGLKDFVSFTMETVEPDMAWASFKLVATMVDGTISIVFFTDPNLSSGQFQILGFSNDFSEVLLDSGAMVWGSGVSGSTDTSDEDDTLPDSDSSNCTSAFEFLTASESEPAIMDIGLRFECWDATQGIPSGVSYLNQSRATDWQAIETFAMEPVDADNAWASHKLVSTLADGTHRIIFFTDPSLVSGQLHILAFSSDYADVVFDTGYRYWGQS